MECFDGGQVLVRGRDVHGRSARKALVDFATELGQDGTGVCMAILRRDEHGCRTIILGRIDVHLTLVHQEANAFVMPVLSCHKDSGCTVGLFVVRVGSKLLDLEQS